MSVLKILAAFLLALMLVGKWNDPPKEGRLTLRQIFVNLLIAAAFVLAVLFCLGIDPLRCLTAG